MKNLLKAAPQSTVKHRIPSVYAPFPGYGSISVEIPAVSDITIEPLAPPRHGPFF
jgi:hypothetical protein